QLISRTITDTFEYQCDEGMVQVTADGVPISECTACGETYFGPEAGRIRHNAICRALKLLTPDQIKSIRERFQMTQRDFEKHTGIGEATVSRWERGRLLQSRAHDNFLRLLGKNPSNLEILRRQEDCSQDDTIDDPILISESSTGEEANPCLVYDEK